MGGTGDPPVPVGDSPTGRPGLSMTLWPEFRARTPFSIPSGGSPDGTGQRPVLPIPVIRTGFLRRYIVWTLKRPEGLAPRAVSRCSPIEGCEHFGLLSRRPCL